MAQTVDRKMVKSWTEELEAVNERLSAHFARSEVRQRAQDYLHGLLSEAKRKNSWQLAEVAGNALWYPAPPGTSQLGCRCPKRGLEGVCHRASPGGF